ncbi:MAG: response regulator [Byssovorax sp.]
MSSKRQTILIVDDKLANLRALENTISGSGLDVEIVAAQSGNDGLIATLNHDFALCILDVQMPEMSGYEIARLLKGESKTRLLPIIFLTAALLEEDEIVKGYEAGGVDYIIKPFNPLVILSKVNVFLELDRQKNDLIQQREQMEALALQLQEQVREKQLKDQLIVQQAKAIFELSTPVLEVGERILVVPLIGALDRTRANQLTDTILQKILETKANVIIIDVSGMLTIDTAAASDLMRSVKAAKLLGARCILTGISAANAQALMRARVDVTAMTKGSLRAGLQCAFNWTTGRGG